MRTSERGISLIELLFAISVFSVMTASALPGLPDAISRHHQLESATQEIEAQIQTALLAREAAEATRLARTTTEELLKANTVTATTVQISGATPDPLNSLDGIALRHVPDRAPQNLLAHPERVHVGGVEEVDAVPDRLVEESAAVRLGQHPVAPAW